MTMRKQSGKARWQSGYAADCKSVDLGSTPGRASIISKASLLWLAFLGYSARKSFFSLVLATINYHHSVCHIIIIFKVYFHLFYRIKLFILFNFFFTGRNWIVEWSFCISSSDLIIVIILYLLCSYKCNLKYKVYTWCVMLLMFLFCLLIVILCCF